MTATPFDLLREDELPDAAQDVAHIYRGHVCDTENRGFPTPQNKSPLELLVNVDGGFVPLWARNSTLRYRFQARSLVAFRDPEAVKATVRNLLAAALAEWGDAAPVRFAEREDAWDFEIALRVAERCSPRGCVLASAFFPDQGQHELVIYPTLFAQSPREQVETLIHEIGHVFGLRHFFAQVSEQAFPSEVFGTHDKFTIMNYGPDSYLTDTDRTDLRNLYQQVWAGSLTEINGTPIQLVKPFSWQQP